MPRTSYEICFEAARTRGDSNAGSIAFPLGVQACSWAIGNLGKNCGLDVIDDLGDREPQNPTWHQYEFTNGRWYRFRLRVEPNRVQAWVEQEQVVDFAPAGHRVELWGDYEDLKPLGFYAARGSTARVRDIRLRHLKP